MELRHLRYFVTVAETLHFSRAAERLHIAQPPLSQQIQALEAMLGVELLRRTRRRVELTEAGRLFLDEARATLAQAERAAEVARRAGRGALGRLAIGFTEAASLHPTVAAAIRAHRQAFPEVDLSLSQIFTRGQLEALAEGRIDAGFARSPRGAGQSGPARDRAWDDIAVRTVAVDPLVVALPADHPAAALEQVPLELLRDEPFVLVPPQAGASLMEFVMQACAAAGFAPRIAQLAPQLASLVALVAAGLGVAMVPGSFRPMALDGVVYRPLAGDPAHIDIVLVHRADDPSPVLKAFVDLVGRVAAGADRPTIARKAPS